MARTILPTRVFVVGGGVMGSVAAALVKQRLGLAPVVFDDGRPFAGSIPSAGLIHENWSPLSKEETKQGLEVLEELYGLAHVRLRVLPKVGMFIDTWSVSPNKFLWKEPLRTRVVKVGDGWVQTEGGITHVGYVLVATGCWANELLHDGIPKVEPYVGQAFIYPRPVVESTIQLWAPFRHQIVFERDPGTTWVGDGLAITRKTFEKSEEKYRTEAQARANKAFPHAFTQQRLVGYRPYVRGNKLGIFQHMWRDDSRTWVMTGGAKGGTLLAAHYARQWVSEIEQLELRKRTS